MRLTAEFQEAQALAEFANLQSANVEGFRNNYPNFAPDSWWDSDVPHTDFSKDDKQLAREMWVSGADCKRWQFTRLYLKMDWGKWDFTQLMQLMWMVFDTYVWEEHSTSVFASQPIDLGRYEFHRALLWLFQNKWRAKKCEECNQCIVVGVATTRYCYRDECGNNEREKRIRATKLRYYHRNKRLKKKLRSKRRK